MQEVFNMKLELKLKKIQKMQKVLEEEVERKQLELKNTKAKFLLQKEEFEKESTQSFSKPIEQMTDKWNVVLDSLDEVLEDDDDKSKHQEGMVVEL